jgi:hypothetical protein
MKFALCLVAAAGAVALALPVQAAQAAKAGGDNTCFRSHDIRNHTVGDSHTLYFDVDGRWVYRATVSNNCLAAAVSSDPIVLRQVGGSGYVCKKIDLDVSVRGTRCIVDTLTRLTPEEAAALPKKIRP